MKEHPIPQDITGYRFHIIGSMTLKQFGEVLVGIIISFIIYQTNLFFVLKWGLIALFTGAGLISAFFPIEERPLSHWIVTFFTRIYRPTQFFWKRVHNIPQPFLYKSDEANMRAVQEVDLTPQRKQRIKEYLTSTRNTRGDDGVTTVYEQTRLSGVLELFDTMPAALAADPVLVNKPALKVRVRSMRVAAGPGELPDIEHIAADSYPEDSIPSYLSAAPSLLPDPTPVVSEEANDRKAAFLETAQVAQNITIPEQQVISVKPTLAAEEEEKTFGARTNNAANRAFIPAAATPTLPEQQPTTAATFNKTLPFPDKPTIPNKLVGMVLTPDKDIVPNAIVEIAQQDGHIARAVKTNALGQFTISTPLKSGKYVVRVQKDPLAFQPIAIELKNSIVDPLEIISS
jgi:hypothetical protein